MVPLSALGLVATLVAAGASDRDAPAPCPEGSATVACVAAHFDAMATRDRAALWAILGDAARRAREAGRAGGDCGGARGPVAELLWLAEVRSGSAELEGFLTEQVEALCLDAPVCARRGIEALPGNARLRVEGMLDRPRHVDREAIAAAGCLPFDGFRWRSMSREERLGFLAGTGDCEGGDGRRLVGSWYVALPLVSAHYARTPADRLRPIAEVLLAVEPQERPRVELGAELHPEKHGFFDGDYWRQADAAHRRGFVEGYLECLRHLPGAHGPLQEDAAWYLPRISGWYGVRDDDGTVLDPARAGDKIADVLVAVSPAPRQPGAAPRPAAAAP
jgi:hypothetical protein